MPNGLLIWQLTLVQVSHCKKASNAHRKCLALLAARVQPCWLNVIIMRLMIAVTLLLLKVAACQK